MRHILLLAYSIITMQTVGANETFRPVENGHCDIKNTSDTLVLWYYEGSQSGPGDSQWLTRYNSEGKKIELATNFEGLHVIDLGESDIKVNNSQEFKAKMKVGVYKMKLEFDFTKGEGLFYSKIKGFNAPGDGYGYTNSAVNLKLENCQVDLSFIY